MVVGRGSSIEAFPLFGYDLKDYDALFAEKLDLLLTLRANEQVTWSGEFRPALNGGRLPEARAGSAADLARRRWNAALVRACRLAWTAVDGRDYRWGPAPLSTAG